MIKHELYEGQIGDSFEVSLKDAIKRAKEIEEDVFFRWNGVTLRVKPKSSYENLCDVYDEGLNESFVFAQKRPGELISVSELSEKIAKFIANL